MDLSCRLSPLIYAELYRLLSDDPYLSRIERRLAVLDRSPTWLGQAEQAYRAAWSFDATYCATIEETAVSEARDAELATWLIAPLRVLGPSVELSHDLSQSVAEVARVAFPTAGLLPEQFSVSIVAWTLGRVCGRMDRTIPVIPADGPDDEHVRSAYLGLLEHVAELPDDGGPWAEMRGSSILWRVAGIAEGLLPHNDLSRSLAELTRAMRPVLPHGLGDRLVAGWDEFRRKRNGYTHVAPEGGGYGFAELGDEIRLSTEVRGYVQAASYFVCNAVSETLASSDATRGRGSMRAEPLRDFDWALGSL